MADRSVGKGASGRMRLSDISSFFARLFDSSLTFGICERLRRSVLRLRLRVVGVFLTTFGIYSLIASLLMHFFSSRSTGDGYIYFGICLAAVSIPLLLSGENISSALLGSVFGNTLCELLGIRRESFKEELQIGRPNIGFVAGVVFGTLTLFFSPFKLIAALLFAVAAGIILTYPEAGLIFEAAGLLIFSGKTHCAVIFVTFLSYILKLAVGKRSLRPEKTDIIPAALGFTVIGGALFSIYGPSWALTLKYCAAASGYFLCVLLCRECRRITQLSVAACTVGELIAGVYVLGDLLCHILPSGSVFDSEALLDFVMSLSAFRSGYAPVILASLLPLSTGLAIRSQSTVPRGAMIMCCCIDLCALILMGEVSCIAAALVGVLLVLLSAGRRSIYVSLALILGAAVIFSYQRPGQLLCERLWNALTEKTAAVGGVFGGQAAADKYFFCGRGFEAADSLTSQSFYAAFRDALGAAGYILLVLLAAFIIFEFVNTVKSVSFNDISSDAAERFGSVRSASDTRIGASSPLGSLTALLVCGCFTDLCQSTAAFMLIWIYCGMGVSYGRSARREIDKAIGAEESRCSAERASVSIVFERPKKRRSSNGISKEKI